MSGSGVCTEEDDDPYVITNDQELQSINEDLDACYVLGTNIDASGTSEWNSNAGFDHIGNSEQFNGSLDGQGYVVDGLTIDRPAENSVGLIGENEGTVEKLVL